MDDRSKATLDKFVLHAAMHDARRLVDGGLSIDDAARRACNGALRDYRTEVERRLHDERALA
ncbi:MAG: hypothetical protein VW644_06175 [Alphaproteobacteria bacterium]|jgi:hypothetical protein